MTFAEKLDLLMSVTKTSNSLLAGRVALDASYISRLRRGKRLMPKDKHIIQDMAACLARRCCEDYQKKALADALKLAAFPDNTVLAGEIARWLRSGEADHPEKIGQFLRGLAEIGGRQDPTHLTDPVQSACSRKDISIYYGVEGKRSAAEAFLSEVAERQIPQTLLLFSDEDTSWMAQDPVYARKWAELMRRVLAKGNHIKVIHTISRDLDEMLRAISQWMPLYMSGLIEPYFYPKKKDGIFKRTLFIAPETAAVVANSVGDQISQAANILYRDQAAVHSFMEEFLQYLRLCRPLMRIFTDRDREECFATLAEFEREQADTLIKTESLSLLTMPETLLASILDRSGFDGTESVSLHRRRCKLFLERLQTNRFTEIISLPDFNTVKSGAVKVSLSDMLGGGAVYYTPPEFVRHLERIIALLSGENYHVHLTGRAGEDQYTVYAREEIGAIVAKTSQPPLILAMSEGNMTAAFWDFLTNMIGEKAYAARGKADTAAALQKYLAGLKYEL